MRAADYQSGHFDGCLGLQPSSMGDAYLTGYFAGDAAR